ncbi:MAG: autorepressor SdpR family transcription factor [Candidatus Scatomorpha sp.]|jgi:DNA-binding transcriptional ArsR family regulator
MGLQETMRALADPTRRDILSLLREGKLSAGDISAHFPISNAAVSRHLSVLREAGLVRDERTGKNIFYELNTSVLEDALAFLSGLTGKKRGESEVRA